MIFTTNKNRNQMKPLQEQFANFIKASEGIDLNRFYHIEITEFQMRLQGQSDSENIKYCNQLTEMRSVSNQLGEYFEGFYNEIKIVLI